MSETNVDRARHAALERIEKSRKLSIVWLAAAAVFEAIAFVAILFAIDFANPTHLVVFLCSCLVYGPLAFGLFALRSYVDLSAQRILKAVELAAPVGHDA